jgi:hypothetical protein
MLRRCFCLALVLAAGLFSRAAGADERATVPNEPGAPAAPRPNRAPKLDPSFEVLPIRSSHGTLEYTRLRVGRPARIVVRADDPDGDVLRFSVEPLPPGATFDAETGSLAWLPATLGRYQLEFSVTDGSAVARRSIAFVVGPNRAPIATDNQRIWSVERSERESETADLMHTPSGNSVVAYDPDADAVTVLPRALPPGARLEVSDAGSGVELHWRPTHEDLGEHELVFDVSDGELTTRLRRQVTVLPAWAVGDSARWLLLGGGPAMLVSHADAGVFLGGAFDVSLAAIRRSGERAFRCGVAGGRDECSASHHRFYAEFEVLDAVRAGVPSLFTYGAGYSASLEVSPARRYLIPHYGVEMGGVVVRDVGHLVQTRPYLGVHLLASDAAWLNVALGYRVVPARLAELGGPTLGLKLVLAPW